MDSHNEDVNSKDNELSYGDTQSLKESEKLGIDKYAEKYEIALQTVELLQKTKLELISDIAMLKKKQITKPVVFNDTLRELNREINITEKEIKDAKKIYKEIELFINQLKLKQSKLFNIYKNIIENVENKKIIGKEIVVNNLIYDKQFIESEEYNFPRCEFKNNISQMIDEYLKKIYLYIEKNSTGEVKAINFNLFNDLLNSFSSIITYFEDINFEYPKLNLTFKKSKIIYSDFDVYMDKEANIKENTYDVNTFKNDLKEGNNCICKEDKSSKAYVESNFEVNKLILYIKEMEENYRNIKNENTKLLQSNKKLSNEIKEISDKKNEEIHKLRSENCELKKLIEKIKSVIE
ncbi:hypothetical protein H312_01072 [Anncaliia algerae PRA339]|uniref:Uncharacterized protein n=1 Tax=Anncaliia algerae PRA339 TaxID=1288291 RepID=A0A059F3C6_9MICR|nr:hypothetical protein H312_01072 [Anncaliia algerae PRA339]